MRAQNFLRRAGSKSFFVVTFLYTKMRNVAGLSTTDAQKSSDMFAKCRYLDEITKGRGIVFATGTPISNSMTEMFTIQRFQLALGPLQLLDGEPLRAAVLQLLDTIRDLPYLLL